MIISSLKLLFPNRSFPGPFRKSENDLTFTLSPEQKDRLITDEQVRYQGFLMLSWERVGLNTFEYKGLYRMSWNQIVPKLKLLQKALKVMVLIRSVGEI